MDEQNVASVPFFVHEATVERLERANKRWFVLALVIFVLFVATNAGWLIYESQFVDEQYSVEVTQDTVDGGSNDNNVRIMGGDYYGETNGQDYIQAQSATH